MIVGTGYRDRANLEHEFMYSNFAIDVLYLRTFAFDFIDWILVNRDGIYNVYVCAVLDEPEYTTTHQCECIKFMFRNEQKKKLYKKLIKDAMSKEKHGQ